jgi:hypothetical protein
MLQEISELTEQLLVADEELRVQNDELERTRRVVERLAAEHDELFVSSPQPLLHTDLQGIVVNSNRAARRLFGEREQDITAIRPIATKFALGDRAVIRSLVSRASCQHELTGTAAVRGRGTPDVPCRVSVRRITDLGTSGDLLLWSVSPDVPTVPSQPTAALSTVTELTRQLANVPVDDLMPTIIDLARLCVPAATHATITLARRTKEGGLTGFTTGAASDAPFGEFAQLAARGTGPVAEAMNGDRPVSVSDLGADPRWSALGAPAAQLGVRSLVVCPMSGPANRLAALTLYATAPNAFSAEQVTVASAFSFHAGSALSAADRERNLRTAIETREIIGQAIGILMERDKLTPVQAFDLLVHVSQNRHIKLREVAQTLTETGEI